MRRYGFIQYEWYSCMCSLSLLSLLVIARPHFVICNVGRSDVKLRAHKGDSWFNYIIDLPRKDGKRKPLFDYEGILYKALMQTGYLNCDPALYYSDPRNILHAFKERVLIQYEMKGDKTYKCV